MKGTLHMRIPFNGFVPDPFRTGSSLKNTAPLFAKYFIQGDPPTSERDLDYGKDLA